MKSPTTTAPQPSIFTPDQRLRVFISSTLQELAPERQAVRDAIVQLRLVPVMFEHGARPHPPRDVYRAYLAQSQLFIGVYGESYGWVAPQSTVSGIEDEHRLAGALPRLIYVKTPAPDRDPRLVALIDDIMSTAEVSVRNFATADELRRMVEHDVALLLSERFAQQDGPTDPEPAAAVPVARSTFVDRESEMEALTALLTDDSVQLITLVGPGGVGKTRLATETAARLGRRFPEGVRYVELSAVTTPEQVGEALAASLGVRTSGSGDPVADVAAYLRVKRLLLIVDNFEQVADAAPVIADLLDGAPGVTALVTSRSRLRITGEHTYLVPPLSVPGTEVADVTVARRHGAVGLFVDRALAAADHFKLTADNVAAVIEICRRLDGLPLSIELAAAKVRMLAPAAILDRLGCGLDLLTGGDRDRPVRQQTLRSTIAWSHDLVPRREQNLFARLAVFDGGFELRAVESIATRFAGDDTDVLECLGALVDNSLVKQEPAASGAPRFRMLDSIREYALERLHDSGEWSVAHHAHAEWYLALALEAETHLNQSAEPEWLDRLEVEHDNVTSAMDWFLDEQQPDLALRLGEAIWVFSWLHGHIDEAMRYLTRVCERCERLSPYSRGRALLARGATSLASGDFAHGESQLVAAREMLCHLGDDLGVARADGPLAHLAIVRHDYARAREYLEEARLISERTGEQWQISLYHSRMAMIALDERRYSDAESHLLDALTVGRRTHERLGTVVAHYGLAVSAFAQGDVATARARLTEGLSYAYRTGDRNSPALFLQALADVEARDHPERAARLAAAARSLRTRSGMIWLNAYVPPWPTSPVDLRVELGDAGFERADSEGAALGLERAVALVTPAHDLGFQLKRGVQEGLGEG